MNTPSQTDATISGLPPAPGGARSGSLPWDKFVPWVFGLYALIAWLMLLVLPSAPPLPSTDGSWQAVLHYAAAHHWQSGVDVVTTYGPLGYLQCSRQYVSGTYVACIIYQLLYKTFYVGLLVYLARQVPRGAAVAFVLANTLMPLLDDDSIYLLAIGYSALVLSGGTRTDRWWALPTLAFLATAALMKEVFLIYGVFALAVVSVFLFISGRWRHGLLILGGFGLCFFVADVWLGGQSLLNLPAFLRNSWSVVSGYPAAMEVRPPNSGFLNASVLVLVLVGWHLLHAGLLRDFVGPRASRVTWRNGMVFLFGSAGLFFAWKAGFTRADPSHEITFFAYAIAIDAAVPVLFPGPASHAGLARTTAWPVYLVPLLVAWTIFQNPSWTIRERTSIGRRVDANLNWLLLPGWEHEQLEAAAKRWAAKVALPRCRAVVGDATVDLFGCEQTVLLENGLRYQPAPVFQPFSTLTPRLLELNASFYRSERAPQFVLFKPDVIDRRFPTQENGRVLTWLLRHYRPVLVENGFLLLREKTRSSVDSAFTETVQPLSEGELLDGTKVTLPRVDGAIWCEMDWRPNLRGQLTGLIFQPPICELDVFAPGARTPRKYRIVPEMARAGFLLTPTVASRLDFLRLLAGNDEGQQVEAVAIHVSSAFRGLMQPSVRYHLYKLPSFTSENDAAQAAALLQEDAIPPAVGSLEGTP